MAWVQKGHNGAPGVSECPNMATEFHRLGPNTQIPVSVRVPWFQKDSRSALGNFHPNGN